MDNEQIKYACCVAAIRSTTDDNDDPLEQSYEPEDCPAEFDSIVAKFLSDNHADCTVWAELYGEESTGHDLWLTAQGHGAGFWDRGAGELGERLTQAAKHSGFYSRDLYIGDDGQLYLI